MNAIIISVLHPHIYDPNLLLKGLAFLCERNCAN